MSLTRQLFENILLWFISNVTYVTNKMLCICLFIRKAHDEIEYSGLCFCDIPAAFLFQIPLR